jgi:hypothetical protein
LDLANSIKHAPLDAGIVLVVDTEEKVEAGRNACQRLNRTDISIELESDAVVYQQHLRKQQGYKD